LGKVLNRRRKYQKEQGLRDTYYAVRSSRIEFGIIPQQRKMGAEARKWRTQKTGRQKSETEESESEKTPVRNWSRKQDRKPRCETNTMGRTQLRQW
jgi:hypothetical protein